jgi:dienelactone hydrolase
MDTSLLIDHLGSYVFHGPDERSIIQNIVMGISLGGHAAWQVLFNDERVTAAVVIIGCPDYMREFHCFVCSCGCVKQPVQIDIYVCLMLHCTFTFFDES